MRCQREEYTLDKGTDKTPEEQLSEGEIYPKTVQSNVSKDDPGISEKEWKPTLR